MLELPSPSEKVTRFSFLKNHIFRKDLRDKRGNVIEKGEMTIMSALFDPYPIDNKASVSRISGLDDGQFGLLERWLKKKEKKMAGGKV